MAASYICALRGKQRFIYHRCSSLAVPSSVCVCDVCLRCVHTSCNTHLSHCFSSLSLFFSPPQFLLSFHYQDGFDILYIMWSTIFFPPYLVCVCVCACVCVCETMMHVLFSDGKSSPTSIWDWSMFLIPMHLSTPVLLASVSYAWCLSLSCCRSLSRCWLRLDTYFIWSFIGPATLIIMVRYAYMHARTHLT